MEIYHNQLSTIFNMNLYKTYGDINKFMDGSTKLAIDEKLSVKILLAKNETINTLQEFNFILSQYRENFLRYPDFFSNENSSKFGSFHLESSNQSEIVSRISRNRYPQKTSKNLKFFKGTP